MKVFISWSGDTSRAVAEQIRRWLPAVIQAVEPYFSPDDISKGTRWTLEIATELEASSVGVLCLTRDNLQAPWIMFEAGALSKSIGASRICPLLFDIDPTEVSGPLVQFQAAQFGRNEMRRVLSTINATLGDRTLSDEVLDAAFAMAWPSLEDAVADIMRRAAANPVVLRSQQDMVGEILSLSRELVRVIQGDSTQALFYTRPFDGFRYFTGMTGNHNFPALVASSTTLTIFGKEFEREFPLASFQDAVNAYRELLLRKGYFVASGTDSTEDELPSTGLVHAAVQTFISGLAPQDQLILRLRFESEMTIAQIARVLRLPQRPLYRRMGRLFNDLRNHLESAGFTAVDVGSILATGTTGPEQLSPSQTDQ